MNPGLFGADAVLRGLTGALCGQSGERDLDLGAAPSFLCARCTGLWIGVLAGALVAGAWARRAGAGRAERSVWTHVAALLVVALLMAAHALSGSPGGATGRVLMGGAFGLAVGAALAAWAWPAQPEGDGAGRWLVRRGLLLVDVVAVLAVLLLDLGRGAIEGLVFAGVLTAVHGAWRGLRPRPSPSPPVPRATHDTSGA